VLVHASKQILARETGLHLALLGHAITFLVVFIISLQVGFVQRYRVGERTRLKRDVIDLCLLVSASVIRFNLFVGDQNRIRDKVPEFFSHDIGSNSIFEFLYGHPILAQNGLVAVEKEVSILNKVGQGQDFLLDFVSRGINAKPLSFTIHADDKSPADLLWFNTVELFRSVCVGLLVSDSD